MCKHEITTNVNLIFIFVRINAVSLIKKLIKAIIFLIVNRIIEIDQIKFLLSLVSFESCRKLQQNINN